jgi:thiamine biosynthesis lipoprotein
MRATALLAGAAWMAAAGSQPAAPPLLRHEATRVSMGCTYAIAAVGPDRQQLIAAADAALDEVDRIDRLMSHYKATSELSLVNREAAGKPVVVDRELFWFLERCQHWARVSDGAFDVTVGPLVTAWGFRDGDGRIPGPAQRARALHAVGYQNLVLDPGARTVRFSRPGMALDLGGIAKGYAVDRAIQVLRAAGVEHALVSAGGSSVYGMGHPEDADAWAIDVDPGAGGAVRTVRLRDRALSVSGTSVRSFVHAGVRYGHIFDPRTGTPVRSVKAVAILGATGTDTDALDEVVAVEGPERARGYLPVGTEAMVFLNDGRVVHTIGQ